MRRVYLSTIKRFLEIQDEFNSLPLELIDIYNDLDDPFIDCENKLPDLTNEQLEEWKFTGLSNWSIIERIYKHEIRGIKSIKGV